MSSIKDVVAGANVDSLQTVTETAGKKYLCFTRLSSDSWILCVTDGFDLWRLALDINELESHRDLAEVNMDAFLNRFRTSFDSDHVRVTQSSMKVTLQIGQGLNVLPFVLYEAKAADKKSEFSTILFKLAESVTNLQSQLEKANSTIETLKQSKDSSSSAGGIFDQDVQKKTQKAQVKAVANMSVINPGSKKRKAAQGVQFE